MLANAKRVYKLAEFTVERRPKGWFFNGAHTSSSSRGWLFRCKISAKCS
jgi:hypothetical protein